MRRAFEEDDVIPLLKADRRRLRPLNPTGALQNKMEGRRFEVEGKNLPTSKLMLTARDTPELQLIQKYGERIILPPTF